MKSLYFEFAKVHKFVGKYKEHFAGLVLLNTILFALACCSDTFNAFFKVLFVVVFAYSNFRVLKLLSDNAVFTQKLCKTTAKFIGITIVQFVIICIGFKLASCFYFSTSLPILLALFLAAAMLYITSYLVLMFQGAFIQIFANATPFFQALSNASAPFAALGNKEKSSLLVSGSVKLFILFLLYTWSTTTGAFIILFILANFQLMMTTAFGYFLNETAKDEAAVAKRTQDLAELDHCDCTTKDFVVEYFPCMSKGVARFFDPANIGRGIRNIFVFFFMAVAGVFQTIYAIIDDIKESSGLCRAAKKAKKEAQAAADADKASTASADAAQASKDATAATAATTATTATVASDATETADEKPDTLEHARYTENPGKPNETDTLAEEFKTTDEASTADQASDEAAYEAKEARDDAKDAAARAADEFQDVPFKTHAEEQAEAEQALAEADELKKQVEQETAPKNVSTGVSTEAIVAAEAAMSVPGTSAQSEALETGENVSSSESMLNQFRDGIEVNEFPAELAEDQAATKAAEYEAEATDAESLVSHAPAGTDSVLDDPKFQQAPEASKDTTAEVMDFTDFKKSPEALEYQDYQDYLDDETKDSKTTDDDLVVPKKKS